MMCDIKEALRRPDMTQENSVYYERLNLGQIRIIDVIQASIKRGKGTDDDPMRHVIQYWSLDGYLLAEYDPEE
jgi:hypothetical protein